MPFALNWKTTSSRENKIKIQQNTKILILGGNGLVGSAFKRSLDNALTPSRAELNLCDQSAVLAYFNNHKPELVINAAAKVGGINANNTLRADFIFDNLQIQINVYKACIESGVDTLLNFGSNCAYPRNCPQPMKEEYLLTGPLEPTNEPYAVAKIASLKIAESFRRQYGKNFLTVIPTTLYGPKDNFNPEAGHVLPGIIARMHHAVKTNASSFEVWGTGTPRREFMYVDDLVDACLFLLDRNEQLPYWINIGLGIDITIRELVETIALELGFNGQLVFNTNRPDGMPRKLMDTTYLAKMGWQSKVDLKVGLRKTIDYYLSILSQ